MFGTFRGLDRPAGRACPTQLESHFRAPFARITDGQKNGVQNMRNLLALVVIVCFLGTAFPKDRDDNDRKLVRFNSLAAVVPPFTGNANPIRNLGGGGAPWKIAEGEAQLKANGEIEVSVRGLVLVNTGANPIANFAVILSCQGKDAAGAPTVINQVAGTTPATTTGDADFEGIVQLSSPCFAPIVFVAIPATATAPARWLAISGF